MFLIDLFFSSIETVNKISTLNTFERMILMNQSTISD